MAPTYKTFQDEESLLSQPPKHAWATRKAAGLGAALLLVAVLGVSTVSHVNPMFDIVSAASGGIDFDRSVKTLAPGYDFNLSLDPGCAETDMYGCSRVPPGSGQAALLYSGKRVCRPPGGRGGAREGYVGRSGSLGSSMGSIWATACPRTWPFGGVHVQSGVRKGPPTSDLCSTD